MTLAGAAVATFATALVLVGLTGGCGNPTDTRHYDQPAPVAPAPQPVLQVVLQVGDTATWGTQ
jgi:hypothetical protein